MVIMEIIMIGNMNIITKISFAMIDDYGLGFQKGRTVPFNHFQFFPLKLFKKINQFFYSRLHEIVDYIEGYWIAFKR